MNNTSVFECNFYYVFAEDVEWVLCVFFCDIYLNCFCVCCLTWMIQYTVYVTAGCVYLNWKYLKNACSSKSVVQVEYTIQGVRGVKVNKLGFNSRIDAESNEDIAMKFDNHYRHTLQKHSSPFLTQRTYSCSNFVAISSLVLELLRNAWFCSQWYTLYYFNLVSYF